MGEMILRLFKLNKKDKSDIVTKVKDLSQGRINENYRIISIESDNEEIEKFLFSLGCYENEIITLVSKLGDNYVIKVKDGRYSIDKHLASAISVQVA